MKNLIVITLLTLSACQSLVVVPDPTPSSTPNCKLVATSPTGGVVECNIPSPSPTAAPSSGTVHFVPDPYYTTPEQRKLIADAEAKANEMKNSDCVHDFLATRKMIQTNGKTDLQVADEVRAASGNIPVQFYYNYFGSAVAYREPPSLTIHLNGRVYSTWSSVCEVVSVLLHESIGHSLLNYDHDYKWSASREYSVPYSINHAVDTGTYSLSPSAGCCK